MVEIDNTNIPIEAALKIADKHLQKFGIKDRMIVKLKPFDKISGVNRVHRDALAMYINSSQYTYGYPIFWINTNFADKVSCYKDLIRTKQSAIDTFVKKELVGTLLHEYGHVIAEFLRGRDYQGKDRHVIYGELVSEYPNEEVFADEFMSHLIGIHSYHKCEFMDRIIEAYVKEAFNG